jgi:UDP-N-acetylglucosamine--N-acetylmuramyl-(pentapeptide) pyrophosphoryl-undecaprenol N-acetylglucosamine transferase
MSPALPKKDNSIARKGGVKILVVSGSSGGHIFPALSLIKSLKNRHKEIDTLLILPRSSLKYNLVTNQIENKVNYVSIYPIKLSISFKNILAALNFLKGTLQSLFIILKFRPDIVVGFGSLVCIPTLMLAWIFRLKTLIHEQNVVPGRTNRLLAKFTDKIAISFEQTRDYLKVNKDMIALTGNPIRQELKRIDRSQAFNFFGLNDDKFTILVMGGSMGSNRINTCFFNAVSTISNKFRFQIIHIAGASDYNLLYNSYKDLDLRIKLFTFLKDMQYAYSICDLVVCRAGATTIAELINFNLPAIIVPYPYAYSHQLSNAKVLEKKGCAVVIKDSDLGANILKEILDDFMNNPNRLALMRSGYGDFLKADADDLLADEVLSLENR